MFAQSQDKLGRMDVLQHKIVTDGAAAILETIPREKGRNAYNVE